MTASAAANCVADKVLYFNPLRAAPGKFDHLIAFAMVNAISTLANCVLDKVALNASAKQTTLATPVKFSQAAGGIGRASTPCALLLSAVGWYEPHKLNNNVPVKTVVTNFIIDDFIVKKNNVLDLHVEHDYRVASFELVNSH
jgi:hypothetical protein